MIDQVLGHYRILQKIGHGGMGDVHRARDGRLDRDVAIKILKPASASDADRLRRFEQEARAAAALNHPNIVAIYDIGSHEGSPYIVSELLEGETLRQKLIGGALSVRVSTDYGRQIASGLVAAHEKRIIHRDLKPENLFVTRDGQVKILDFGIAKLTAQESEETQNVVSMTTQTKVGTVLGTVGYMSPEQLRGKPVDHRTDIFSLGAILYEMLSGVRAFRGETEVDTMMSVLNADPPELTATRENIPVVFEQIVQRCLEKDPENRFQTARDLAFALSTVSGTTSSKQIVVGKTNWTKVRKYAPWVVVGLVVLGFGMVLQVLLGPNHVPESKRVTFERGTVYSARFRPDGRSILYSAAWNGQPMEIYSTVGDSPQAQPLAMKSQYLMGVSRDNQLAVALHWIHGAKLDVMGGVLAQEPLAGGTPREILEDVLWSDWSPDGRLAVVHHQPGRTSLEFPIGNVLYQTSGTISHIRFSPKGDRIAFLDHPLAFDDSGSVCVVDLAGKKATLSSRWESEAGLAWSPGGDEIWFTAAQKSDSNRELWAVSLSGKLRRVWGTLGGMTLQDISSDGRVLITAETERLAMEWSDTKTRQMQDLSWYDWSIAKDVSRDGKWVLFEESSEPAGPNYAVAIRDVNGDPPIRLGEGTAGGLSADGKWAVAVIPGPPPHLTLLPTGPGQPRDIALPNLNYAESGAARFLPDGEHIVLDGAEPGHAVRSYLVTISGAQPPKPLTPETEIAIFSSPDGKYLAGAGAVQSDRQRALTLFRVDGGPSVTLPVTAPTYTVMGWSPDSKELYLYMPAEMPITISKLDIATGKITSLREVRPADRGGVVSVGPVLCDSAATGCAYSYYHTLSVMWVVKGLR